MKPTPLMMTDHGTAQGGGAGMTRMVFGGGGGSGLLREGVRGMEYGDYSFGLDRRHENPKNLNPKP